METYGDKRAFTNSPKCVEFEVRLLAGAGAAQLNTGARVCILLAILMLIFILLRLIASALKLACSHRGWRPLVQHIQSGCIDPQAMAKRGRGVDNSGTSSWSLSLDGFRRVLDTFANGCPEKSAWSRRLLR